MRILIDPSELSSSSLLPPLPNSEPSPGLEELTGCDFAICKLPLPIQENTIEAHIKSGALFIQRKSSYDFTGNFEQVWREIARVQKLKIPASQFYVLAIGRYKPDDNGLLRITGKRPLENNKKLTYKTFLKLQEQLFCSGVRVVQLNDESEIEQWIEATIETRQDITERDSKKELFIQNNYSIYEPENEPDILQEVIEVVDTDIRYFLACGLKGFGQKTANSLIEFAQTQTPQVDRWGVYAIKLLTDEDEKGKAVYNIPGWGNKSREKFRQILGLPAGYNLSVQEIEFDKERAFKQGWRMALTIFKDLLDKGHKPALAFEAVWNFTFEFADTLKDE